jgi:MOB kinase activator 1
MAAPAYIEQLMTWVQATIDNETMLPSRIGKSTTYCTRNGKNRHN